MPLIAVWTVSALITVFVASSKRRNVIGWAMLGAVIGPLAVLAIATASPVDNEARRVRAALIDGRMRRCPNCAEAIQAAALTCPHCGRDPGPVPPPRFWLGRPA